MTANIIEYILNTILEVRKILRQSTILKKQRFKLNIVEKKNQVDIKAIYKIKKNRKKEKY